MTNPTIGSIEHQEWTHLEYGDLLATPATPKELTRRYEAGSISAREYFGTLASLQRGEVFDGDHAPCDDCGDPKRNAGGDRIKCACDYHREAHDY